MQESQERVTAIVQATDHSVSVNDVLKNALDWKQWMADDLRLLIQTAKEETLSEAGKLNLIGHHLKTYQLVNNVFGLVTGSKDERLFDLPELEMLQEIVPELSALLVPTEDSEIEPMLELKLGELSGQLKDLTEHPTPEVAPLPVSEPEETDEEDVVEPQAIHSNETESVDEDHEQESESEEASPEVTNIQLMDETPAPIEPIEETTVAESDSEAVSEEEPEPAVEEPIEVASTETVVQPIADEPIKVPEPAAPSMHIEPIAAQKEDISTMDLMDKIWGDAFSMMMGNDNEVTGGAAY